MAMVSLGTSSGESYPAMKLSPQPKVLTPTLQKIDNELVAQARKACGEKAYDAALKQLTKLLHHKNINVSVSMDVCLGLQQVRISDGETGKRIVDLPPPAVVDIAERARQQHIGWLIDVMR